MNKSACLLCKGPINSYLFDNRVSQSLVRFISVLTVQMRLPWGICILLYLKCVIFSIFVRTLFRAAFFLSGSVVMIKRESGENPEQSRCCEPC